MSTYPPYTLNNNMVNKITSIVQKIEKIHYYTHLDRFPQLRKENRINSIYSSLAIEGNSLSFDDVKKVIEWWTVLWKQKDIQEVKNAYKAYEMLECIDPFSINDLKKVHEVMTFLTIEDNWKFRNHWEGVYEWEKVIFMAPPHGLVPQLVQQLFDWIVSAWENVNPLIISSVFHYEFVFIHPFSDWNWRMARYWNTLLLSKWEDIFTYLPIETMIKKHQEKYYEAINICDHKWNSDLFIEFMLNMIDEELESVIVDGPKMDIELWWDWLSKNELIIIEYIKNNWKVWAKEIIEGTSLADSTTRRILKNLVKKKVLKTTSKIENDPTNKYELVGL